MKILGIDPGLARVGFGLIETDGYNVKLLNYGIIETENNLPQSERLLQIKKDIEELILEYQPDQVAIEELFFVQNITNGIRVAEARGVITVVVAENGILIHEYKPTEVKIAVCSNGHAKKCQIQDMVKKILKLQNTPKPDDAADALTIAITCSQSLKLNIV